MSSSCLDSQRGSCRTHKCTFPGVNRRGRFNADVEMGLKIQTGVVTPVKVLLTEKLCILRPAVEYVEQICKLSKVRTQGVVSSQMSASDFFFFVCFYVFLLIAGL